MNVAVHKTRPHTARYGIVNSEDCMTPLAGENGYTNGYTYPDSKSSRSRAAQKS